MDPNKPLEKRVGHSMLMVRLIALGKILKAASLLIIGYFILHMLKLDRNSSLHDILVEIVNDLRLDENNHFIHDLLEKTIGVSPGTLRAVGFGTLFYSALYFTEGAGLYFDRGWAEWMTIISTAGFIPLEIYEIITHVTILKILIFILNILILVYIAMRLRWRHLAKKEARKQGFPVQQVIKDAQTAPKSVASNL